MGNNVSIQEYTCRERAKKLIIEYQNSKEKPVYDLYRDGGSLRAGDILTRKLDGFSSSQSSGQYSSGSYSGPTASSSGGIFIHYAIYHQSLGDDRHELIEKCDKRNGNYTHIWKVVFTTDQLKQHFKIVIDSRYKATCDMALKIYNDDLDAGYSFSHSNCEHFVTFCLTRHGNYTNSLQVVVPAAVRGMFSTITVPIGLLGKSITHPIYKIGGDMDLNKRLLKTRLPFGLDSDEVVNGLKNGSKIFIGFCVWEIPVPWFPHN